MSEMVVTLNSDMIAPSRREEAEAIVKTYFPRTITLRFRYTESNWPLAILGFPEGAFGSLSDWSATLAARPGTIKDAGEVVKPHVEAELKEMLATKKRQPQPPPEKERPSRGSLKRFLAARRRG